MTDYEFALLQRELQATMEYLEQLQQRHIKETGRRFVISGPARRHCEICGLDFHGAVCPFCKEAVNG